MESIAEVATIAQALAPGGMHRPDRDIDGARDVAEAAGVALEPTIFRWRSGIEQRHVGRPQQATDIRRGQVHAIRPAWRELGPWLGRRLRIAALDRAILTSPGGEPAIE